MSSAPASLAPAGWYTDPLGLPQLRWWNGSSWTNQIDEPSVELQVSRQFRVSFVDSPDAA
ncbi:DUF2510 domain-containing protein [Marisediminicola sp. LYQ134]|uniref:DUF2510 domain-containing protein n=1 Tax=unclassified Marisediminicola TaxID=2618316 RepID=UPI003982E20F